MLVRGSREGGRGNRGGMASCLPIVKLCCLAGAGYITYTCSIELNTYGKWIRNFSLTILNRSDKNVQIAKTKRTLVNI